MQCPYVKQVTDKRTLILKMEPQQLFISYSRRDSTEFVLKLSDDLRRAGATTWIDQQAIQGGKKWDQEIEKAINSSMAVLFVVSPGAVSSDNVLDEIYYALDARIRVIPLVVKICDLPLRVRRLNQVDFSKSYNAGLKKLLSDLGAEEKENEARNSHNHKGKYHWQLNRNTAILFAVVLAIIIAAGFMIANKAGNKKNELTASTDSGPANKEKLSKDPPETVMPADNKSFPSKIDLARALFDAGKADSAVLVLYNDKTRRLIVNKLSDAADSCYSSNSTCYYETGMAFYRKKEFAAALVYFVIGSKSDSKAMCMVGNMYYSGNWVKNNNEEAYKWYKRAAGTNNSVALLMLGIFSLNGKFVQKDVPHAKLLFKRVMENADDAGAVKVAGRMLKSL